VRKSKFKVSFRIRHPEMNPDDICKTLGLEANHKWRAGSKRVTPKGTPLEGTYDVTYCSFKLKSNNLTELADFLKKCNESFYKHKDFFNKIHSTGGSLEYYVGLFVEDNFGEVFDVDLMKELVDLNINLSIDCHGH